MLRLQESFDYEEDSPMVQAVMRVHSSTATTIQINSFQGGAFGLGRCAEIWGSNTWSIVFPDNQPTWITGFHVYQRGNTGPDVLTAILDGGTVQVQVLLDHSTGTACAYVGSTLVATGTKNLLDGHFHWFSCKVVLGTSGQIQVAIDGFVDSALWLSGVNTIPSGHAYGNTIRLGGGAGNNDLWTDNFHICDGTGTQDNDLIPESRLFADYATANGYQNDFTPHGYAGGSDRWNVISETVCDEDSSFIDSGTPGAISSFRFNRTTVPAGAAVGAIKLVAIHRKDDVGPRSISMIQRMGGVNYPTAPVPSLGSYSPAAQLYTINPASGLPYTYLDVNDTTAEVAVQVAS